MKRFIILLFLLPVTALFSTTSVDSRYGWKMLEISSGATMNSLANTGALHSTDSFGFIQNPTSSVFTRKRAISFSHHFWIFDTRMDNLAFVNNQGNYAYGFAVRALDYGTLEARDETGAYIGDFHPLDLNIIANYSHRIMPSHFVGINVRGLYTKIYSASSTGLSTDLAYTYLTPYRGLTVSGVLQNIGKTGRLRHETIKLPFSQHLSIIKEKDFSNINSVNELKIENTADNEIRASLGSDLTIYDLLSFRLGYKINHDSESYSLGFGVNYFNVFFDYAFIPFDYKIDDVHILSITIKF